MFRPNFVLQPTERMGFPFSQIEKGGRLGGCRDFSLPSNVAVPLVKEKASLFDHPGSRRDGTLQKPSNFDLPSDF